MKYPGFLKSLSAAEYRSYFESIYCKGPVKTFDGIKVRFRKRDFNHCFFESVKTKDDTFSVKRAERMLWIKAALQDPSAELHLGWDSKKKRYDNKRRVTLVQGNYVVVIAIKGEKNAVFKTAYVADRKPRIGHLSTVDLIRKSPKWI